MLGVSSRKRNFPQREEQSTYVMFVSVHCSGKHHKPYFRKANRFPTGLCCSPLELESHCRFSQVCCRWCVMNSPLQRSLLSAFLADFRGNMLDLVMDEDISAEDKIIELKNWNRVRQQHFVLNIHSYFDWLDNSIQGHCRLQATKRVRKFCHSIAGIWRSHRERDP